MNVCRGRNMMIDFIEIMKTVKIYFFTGQKNPTHLQVFHSF